MHFGEELLTEREFGNFIDRYAIAVKKDSSGYVPSGFENSFRSDYTCFVENIASINIAQRTSCEMQNLTSRIKSHDKNSNGF